MIIIRKFAKDNRVQPCKLNFITEFESFIKIKKYVLCKKLEEFGSEKYHLKTDGKFKKRKEKKNY